MLTAVRTKNFKKLESFSAEFKTGTNLIIGENAQGKSTIFEAIRFAFFGSRAVTAKVDALTTWNKSGMWVEVDLLGYTIRRTSTNCKITNSEGEVVATGNTPCAKFVEDLLSCPFKDFDLVFMSKQSEAAGLITFGAAELNRKVEEFAGVAVIDRIAKELGSDSNGVRIALESFEYENVEKLKQTADQLAEQEASLCEQLADSQEAVKAASVQVKKLRSTLADYQEFNAEQDRLISEQTGLRGKLTALEAQIEMTCGQVEQTEQRMELCYPVEQSEIEEVKALRTKLSQATTALNQLPSSLTLAQQLDEAKEKVKAEQEWKEALPTLQETLDAAKSVETTTKEKLYDLQTRLKAKRQELAEAEKALEAGVCRSCNRPYEDHNPAEFEAEISAINQQIEALEQEVETQSKLVKDKAKLVVSTNNKLAEHSAASPGTGWAIKVDKIDAELREVGAKRKHLEQTLMDLPTQDELDSKLEKLIGDYNLWSQTKKELASATEQLSTLNERKAVMVAKIESQPQPQPKKDTDEAIAELEEANEVNRTASVAVTRLQGQLSEVTAELRNKKTSLSRAEANNQKMAELQARLSTTKQLAKYLKEERIKFMNGVWSMILGTATNFINKSTSGWITAVGRNEAGDFTFTENGFEAIAKESASGAQKAFIGTALKVGLAQAKMGSHSMVLLDEPTADMSNARAGQLAAGLMGLSGQKIMITHRSSERMTAQNVIQVGE